MRTSYSSLLLLACGTIYSFHNSGGSSSSQNGNASGPPGSAAAVLTTGAEKPADANDENEYARELCKQFVEPDPTGAGGCDLRPGKPWGRLRDIKAPRFIIATVPDPITTHLRVEFDRAIDGIKDAAADEHFLLRRYWFPWPLEPLPQFSDRPSEEAEKKQRALKRRLPGALLFENPEHESLIVLLVGESPTDGVHRQQFQSAIDLKCAIESLAMPPGPNDSRKECYPKGPLRLLGTTFSGSLYTLGLALKGADFEAVSGTVSDQASIDRFNADHPREGSAEPRLRTLMIGSNTALTAFAGYVRDSWHYSDKIAVLSETDTVFGDLRHLDRVRSGNGEPMFFPVPFPRDIAHLRNAYQSDPELSGFGLTSPNMQRKTLALPLDDTENTIDTIPEFAAQTVVSQETQFSQIANRIKHEHIRFAGIIASNVLDALFVTRFLRAASPDTRLFLIQPDLLFVHAASSLPFEGVVAVGTYPLLDGNPPFGEKEAGADETMADEKHWVYPSAFQQGIHNAMRVLLARLFDKPVPHLAGYAPAKPGEGPALWVTCVGRESFVPIAALEIGRPGRPTGAARADRADRPSPGMALLDIPSGTPPLQGEPHQPARIWWLLVLLVALGIVALTVVFCAAQKRLTGKRAPLAPRTDVPAPRRRRKPAPAWLNDLRIQGTAGNRQHLSLLLVFAAGIYLIVVSAGVPALFPPHRCDWPSLQLAALAIVLALGIGGIATTFWIWRKSIRLNWPRKRLVALVGAGVLAVFGWFVFLCYDSTNLSGVFFRFRSFEISAGAAPTVPFLFLFCGFLVCSFTNLQRCIFHHQRLPRLPRAKDDPVLGGDAWHGAKRLCWQFYQPFRHSRRLSVFLAAGAFGLCWLALYISGLRSFEGRGYDFLFISWASALAAALIVVCWRFVDSWRLLDRMLDQLETHPLRRTFSALPADYSWSPIWQSNPRKRSYLILTRSIDSLNALRDTKLVAPDLEALIANSEDRVQVVLARVAHGERETPQEYATAQNALADTADKLIEGLRLVWQRGSSETLDETKDAPRSHDDQSPPLLYAAEFVAMRYMAFIRYAMLQLGNMLTFLMPGFLAFAFALMGYPFAGERSIAWVITILFLAVSAGIALVFTQMATDATLRRITNREQGKLGFDFLHRALAFGVLPLLTVLASNFNGVGRFLFSWIEPALKTLH